MNQPVIENRPVKSHGESQTQVRNQTGIKEKVTNMGLIPAGPEHSICTDSVPWNIWKHDVRWMERGRKNWYVTVNVNASVLIKKSQKKAVLSILYLSCWTEEINGECWILSRHLETLEYGWFFQWHKCRTHLGHTDLECLSRAMKEKTPTGSVFFSCAYQVLLVLFPKWNSSTYVMFF